jgi:hypothetical protein
MLSGGSVGHGEGGDGWEFHSDGRILVLVLKDTVPGR